MVLVALLSVRAGARDGPLDTVPPAMLDFGGQPLIEYQARLALSAGAERIILHVDASRAQAQGPQLSRLADHLTRECDCPVTLVHEMPDLARALSPGDHVLLLAEGLVLPAEALDTMLQDAGLDVSGAGGGGTGAPEEAILVLPSVPATDGLERIDATAMWGGALCVSGGRLLSTLDMLGDWDLVLTLLRRAVQDGVHRVMVPAEMLTQARLSFVTDPESASIALDALSDYGPAVPGEHGAGLSGLFAPVSRILTRELMRRQVEPKRLTIIALAVTVGALALTANAWILPALLAMLAALGLAALAERGAYLTLRATGARWQYALVKAAGLVILVVAGLRYAQGTALASVGAIFPLFFIGLFTFAEERSPPAADWRGLAKPSIEGALLLVLAGVIIGYPQVAFALLGIFVACVVALRLFQIGTEKV